MSDEKKNIGEEMQMAAAEIMGRFKGMGFMLVVFPLGAPGQSNYISNARPQDMAPILKGAAFSIEQKLVQAITPLNGN